MIASNTICQGSNPCIDAKVSNTENNNSSKNYQNEAAKNKITQITAQAEQVVAEAKGAAEAKRLAADAEAYKITTITKALNPAYIELTKATKWNGELPRVQSGTGGMILQMKD